MCRRTLPRLAVSALVLLASVTRAEPLKPAPGSVQVMFLPPPLETAVYSVGVYEAATARLVRRLHEDAEDDAFTAGLNGFITFWDRRDDAGKTVPAARYAARGWAVGEMKVEGEEILEKERVDGDRDLRTALGLDENVPSPVVELPLAKNPLEPGKPQRARLRAGFDVHGSFLETADGLRLLPVSTRTDLRAARLVRDPKDANRLLFYQFDGAAWDVFSITGVPKALVGFDAGEFELTADGERHPLPPTEEPRDP